MSRDGFKNFKPNKNSRFKQGYFRPENPQKYVGDISNIVYRSSWEFKFMKFCDTNDKILKWNFESVKISYWNPVSKKFSNYFVDAWVKVKNDNGEIDEWLLEIKPLKYVNKPIPPKRLTESALYNYAREAKTYLINSAKFEAAKDFCRAKNMKFGIITENFLFNKK